LLVWLVLPLDTDEPVEVELAAEVPVVPVEVELPAEVPVVRVEVEVPAEVPVEVVPVEVEVEELAVLAAVAACSTNNPRLTAVAAATPPIANLMRVVRGVRASGVFVMYPRCPATLGLPCGFPLGIL
jgi:hypothetical protein